MSIEHISINADLPRPGEQCVGGTVVEMRRCRYDGGVESPDRRMIGRSQLAP